MELAARARTWAREVLEEQWAPARFRLEVEREEVRFVRRLGHHVLTVRFRVWERAGGAVVALDRAGDVRSVRFPVPLDELESSLDAPADLDEPPLAAAVSAAREAARATSPRVRAAAGWLSPRRDGALLSLVLERLPADGRLAIDLDARDGGRLGYRCQPFRRGSRRSAALSRFSAVKRARAAVALPEGARLVRCDLVHSGGDRLWRLRWESPGEEPRARGFVAVTLTARTGRVCELTTALRPAGASALPSRAEARRAIELTARVRLGPGATVGPLVRGRRGPPGRRRSVWLAVVHDPAGCHLRATLTGGRVAILRTDEGRRTA